MKIIEPKVELINAPDYATLLSTVEQAGRTCYKSEDKITDGSAEKFVRNILKRGHEAVIEHASLTVRFTCDRGVSHEIVRHRLAAVSGYKELGRVVDKLTREKMISLHVKENDHV